MNSYLLLTVGLVTIFLEFYMPGGILGTLGTLLVVGSVIQFSIESESPIATLLFALTAAASVAALIKFTIWRIKNSKDKKTIYTEDDQEGYYASYFDKNAIGKTGIVSTDLRPGGHIVIDGKSHLAISQSGYVIKGEEVTVIGGEGESLTVKIKKKDQEK